MQNKWLLYLALVFFVFGIMGWTRTAYHLWTNPDAYNEREVASLQEPEGEALGDSKDKADLQKGRDTGKTHGIFSREESETPHREEAVKKAVAQLASLAQVPRGAITIVEVRERVWPDSSLGCPKPGMAYIQIPHEGVSILLQAEGKLYRFHSGTEGEPFLCDDPSDQDF